MSALAPDHDKILRLARLAFIARDNRPLWKADTEAACEEHSEACNALWGEVERQVRLHYPSDNVEPLP